MNANDKKLFLEMLTKAMGAYGKPLPDAGIIGAWVDVLAPYPLSVIGMAFSVYCDENGEFAPVPAGIAKRCKMMDGRPGPEEAWAIGLTGRDESVTVVWTADIAEAFALCQPVLDGGDEVGARMAFKEAYSRIVDQARSDQRPVCWSASLGWDVRKREAALRKASVTGLLRAPVGADLLQLSDGSAINDAGAQNQIAKIKQMMSAMNAEKQREYELHAQRERDATANAKRDANEKVAKYIQSNDSQA